jgi:rhodanese-related sulfurtransferase
MALDKCSVAQASIDTHLAGGLAAWKAAGLPVVKG